MNDGRAFYEAARAQHVCAVCGRGGRAFDAHHVVERQELRRRRLPLYDPRNALRLCDEGARNCHSRHTTATRRVRLVELTDANIGYAWEVLGDFAYDYLHRRYGGEDSRLEERLHVRI